MTTVTIRDLGAEPDTWDVIADGPWLRFEWTADDGTHSRHRFLTASEALANIQIQYQIWYDNDIKVVTP